MKQIHITKTEIIEQLVDYEVNLFNELDETSKQEWLHDFFLNGITGYKSWGDKELLEKGIDTGMFLMEE
jgi:hypothetical protein